jgi:hypothetical protein
MPVSRDRRAAAGAAATDALQYQRLINYLEGT